MVDSPLCLGILFRALLDALSRFKHIPNSNMLRDPITGNLMTSYTLIPNGMLLSSFKKGEVGNTYHCIVGRASSEVQYEGYQRYVTSRCFSSHFMFELDVITFT